MSPFWDSCEACGKGVGATLRHPRESPRQHDGMKLAFLQDDVTTILIPWHQIVFVQLLPGSGIDKVIGFVRE